MKDDLRGDVADVNTRLGARVDTVAASARGGLAQEVASTVRAGVEPMRSEMGELRAQAAGVIAGQSSLEHREARAEAGPLRREIWRAQNTSCRHHRRPSQSRASSGSLGR